MRSDRELGPSAEPFLTVRDAADQLGLPYFKVQRAVKAGLVASYRILNGRRLVRLSELIAAIEASRDGGRDA